MAFNYDDSLTTDLDTIRFRIQDTVEDSGIKPNGANFSDEEINGLLALEGTVERTVAALYETLATVWANYVNTRIGPRSEDKSAIADRYMKLAKQYRADYGYGRTTLRTGFVTRVDGFSDDIDAGEQ